MERADRPPTAVQAIIIVIIRLWAAGKLITGAIGLPMYVSMIMDSGSSGAASLWQGLYNYGAWALAGVGAWILAPRFARHAAPGGDGVAVNVDTEQLVAIGGFLIGAYYLLAHGGGALFEMVRIGEHLLKELSKPDDSAAGIVGWRFLISGLAPVLVALWMMFRPRDLAALFFAARRGGAYKAKYAEDRKDDKA